MLMIALIGSSETRRGIIADKLQSLSRHLSIFNMRHPESEPDRLNVLNKVLNARCSDRQTLIILTVKSAREAQVLRDNGCIFAVIDGQQSNEVPIRKGDLFVTHKDKAQRHYLPAYEMLSEARIVHKNRGKV